MKKLGQNFLIDKNIAELEVKYAKINKEDVILEIGPGKGILTKLLAKKAKKVLAIEIDKKLINNLNKTIPTNVELINKDVLKLDFKDLPMFTKIVSNLPFQISSHVTFKLLDYDFELAILIYQKEFAYRMIANARSKNYSRLSVGVYYKAKCDILRIVPKTCFKPQPKVDSVMVRLIQRKSPPFKVNNEEFFFDLTKNLFNHRRKKIKNIIKSLYNIEYTHFPYLENRVEELTPEQIGELSDIIFEKKN